MRRTSQNELRSTPLEKAAQAVLDARAQFPQSTLADLYDPVAMPPALSKAHAELDRAVDRCYRAQKFENDRQRVEYLFAEYEKLTAPLVAAAKPKRGARGATRPAYSDKPAEPPKKKFPKPTPEQAAADAAHFYSAKEEPPPYHT